MSRDTSAGGRAVTADHSGRRSPRRRWIEVVRACWGTALLLAPRSVLRRIHGVHADPTTIAVARVLGARQLAQAVLSGANPSPEVLAMGVWVDSVHAATAVGLSALAPGRAPAALADAAVAAVWAGAGVRDLTDGVATPPQHDRRRDALARVVLGFAPGGKALLRRVDRIRS